MGLRPLEIFLLLQHFAGIDVSRQNLTYKVDPQPYGLTLALVKSDISDGLILG